MNFDDLFGLGEFGVNLFSNVRRGALLREQGSSFARQAEINMQIGRFNADISERNGINASYAIAAQTKKLLAKQINNMANRGVTMEGSPLFVLGEIETMGENRAQEAMFNSQVQKINYQYSALAAASKANGMAEQAHYASLGALVDTAKSVRDGVRMMNSMFNSPASTMSNGANSVIGSILRAIV